MDRSTYRAVDSKVFPVLSNKENIPLFHIKLKTVIMSILQNIHWCTRDNISECANVHEKKKLGNMAQNLNKTNKKSTFRFSLKIFLKKVRLTSPFES